MRDALMLGWRRAAGLWHVCGGRGGAHGQRGAAGRQHRLLPVHVPAGLLPVPHGPGGHRGRFCEQHHRALGGGWRRARLGLLGQRALHWRQVSPFRFLCCFLKPLLGSLGQQQQADAFAFLPIGHPGPARPSSATGGYTHIYFPQHVKHGSSKTCAASRCAQRVAGALNAGSEPVNCMTQQALHGQVRKSFGICMAYHTVVSVDMRAVCRRRASCWRCTHCCCCTRQLAGWRLSRAEGPPVGRQAVPGVRGDCFVEVIGLF